MEKGLERKMQLLDDYGSPVIGFSGRLSMRKLTSPALEK